MSFFKQVLAMALLLGIGYNLGYWTHEVQDSRKPMPVQQKKVQKIELIESPGLSVTWI